MEASLKALLVLALGLVLVVQLPAAEPAAEPAAGEAAPEVPRDDGNGRRRKPKEGAVAAKPGVPGAGIADSGKADAKRVFERQAAGAAAPTGPAPTVTGAYIWGGRADENYRPFFQWELRVKAGSAALKGLKLRVATLSAAREAQTQGPWKDIGALAAGALHECDYRLNCSAFPAWQVELAWAGGAQVFTSSDKLSVPVAPGDGSLLMAVGQSWEYQDKKRSATVGWTLWNLGTQSASDLTQTIQFIDDKGKEVKSFEVKGEKGEKGELAAKGIREFKVTVDGVPPFAALGIATRQSEAGAQAPDPGAFTGARDLEIAQIRAEGKADAKARRLLARVRNGTDGDLENVVVTISLLGKDGKTVKAVDLPVARLAKGEERDVAGDLAGVATWAGVETSWTGAKAAPRPAAGGEGSAAGITLTVDDVVFIQRSTVADGGKLYLKGDLINRRKATLSSLVVTITASGKGRTASAEYRHEGLGPEESVAVVIEIPGVAALETLSMSWKAAAK